MGDARHRADEEKLGAPDGHDVRNFGASGDHRHDAVSGFKKLFILLLLAAFVFGFRTFIIERVIVSGDSMNPAFEDGDVLWSRKFNVKELDRYQVVVARMDGKLVIKRVIGLPGETLSFFDGSVCINGDVLTDDYGDKTTFYGDVETEILIGENEYFLLGDNRNNSGDSRIWGTVNIDDVKGVIIFRFFPFWKIGFVE